MPKIRPPNTRPVKITAKARTKSGHPPFKLGEVHNPAGRPLGSRQKLGEAFLRDFNAEWERRGPQAMRELLPADLVRAAVALLPKQLEITQEHIYEIRDTPMNADEWQKSCIIEHEPEIIPESDSVN